MKYLIGIDEAGRGPLAGPVSIGVVKVPKNFDKRFLRGIKDSKKLTEKDREEWFKKAVVAQKAGKLDFQVALISEKVIDKKGIVFAISLGIKKCLGKLNLNPGETKVFLDGSLKAPKEFIDQETIIKGDEKIPIISLASVLAKVTRDKKMVGLSKKFPEFSFHLHKGYGTKLHQEAIKTHGPSKCHRLSFIKSPNT